MNTKNELGVVIITYNPDDDICSRVSKIMGCTCIGRIVIVDNNSTNVSILKSFEKYSNISVIYNNDNLGLAKALNQGVAYLQQRSYRYALLLDQDSEIECTSIEILLNTIKNKKCSLVGPQIVLKIENEFINTNYLVKSRWSFNKEYVEYNKLLKILINITSGSLLDISVWDKVGHFCNELFIEGIDDEYCLRLNSSNFSVYIDGSAKLYQQYGNQKHIKMLGIDWYPTFHSPFRLYYLYRNKILIIKRYFFKQPQYCIFQVLSLVKRLVTILITENDKLEKIKYILKGSFHGFIGISGCLK